MTRFQRNVRAMVRAFLLVATPEELQREWELSNERGDSFRAGCVMELIREEDEGQETVIGNRSKPLIRG